MKPIYLKIEGINSFTKAKEIDFEAVTADRIFCICGPTGSGKSTILDCIVLALYAPRSHNRGTMRDYVNLNCEKGQIVFRFAHEDGLYEIERVFKRSSAAAKARLTRLDTGEILADQSDKATDKIVALLKLGYEDFSKVVILEQGQFAKFMNATANQRSDAVAQLFDLMRFDVLKDKFNAAARDCGLKADENKRRLDELSAVTEKAIRETESAEKQAKSEAQNLKAARETVNAALIRAEQSRAEFLACEKARADVTAAQAAIERLKTGACNLENRKTALQTQNTTLLTLKKEAEFARDRLGKIEECKRDAAKCLELESLRESLMIRYKNLAATHAEKTAQKKTLLAEKERLTSEVSRIMREIVPMDTTVSEASTYAVLAEKLSQKSQVSAYAQKRAESAQLDLQKAILDKAAADKMLGMAIAAKNLYAAQNDTAKLDKAAAESARESARKHNAASFLGQGLAKGDACPVCGHTIDDNHVAVSTCDLTAFDACIAEAEIRMVHTQTLLTKSSAEEAENQTKLQHAQERIGTAEAALKKAEQELKEALESFDSASALEKAARIYQSAADKAREAEQKKRESDAVEPALATLSEQKINVETEGKRVREDIDGLIKRIRERLDGAENADLDALQGHAQAQIVQAEHAQTVYESEKESLVKQERVLTASLAAENEKHSAAIKTLAAKGDVTFDAAEAEALRKKRDALDQQISVLDGETARLGLSVVTQKEWLSKKRALEEERSQLHKKLDDVTVMKKMFGGGQFLAFAAEEYILSFTAAASAILSGLTDGKYTLVYEPDENGKYDFWVHDFFAANERRKVKTLSGGETFLASMSVAIAISREIAVGKNFEFFFLDEGFGTLHEKAIDTVAEALKKLSQETIVGLVSHRSELVERISSKIVVLPADEENGSDLQFVQG